LIFFIVRLEKNLRRTKYVIVAPRRIDEVDSEGKTFPATNSFKKGGFRVRGRGRGGGIIAPSIRLNNIPVLIGRGMNYTDEVECFLYYKKKYYLNVCLNNRSNF
jgi:hypothetical protein